jgi:hypothetical protein
VAENLVIDPELKQFVEADVSVVVGSRDAQFAPEIVRGWGPQVMPDGASLEICIDRAAGVRTLANLRDNGRMAVTLTHPISHKAVQFKGRCVEIGDPAAADWPRIERHREAFVQVLGQMGYTREFTRRLWSVQVVKLRLSIEQAFDQTPGPEAGKPL